MVKIGMVQRHFLTITTLVPGGMQLLYHMSTSRVCRTSVLYWYPRLCVAGPNKYISWLRGNTNSKPISLPMPIKLLLVSKSFFNITTNGLPNKPQPSQLAIVGYRELSMRFRTSAVPMRNQTAIYYAEWTVFATSDGFRSRKGTSFTCACKARTYNCHSTDKSITRTDVTRIIVIPCSDTDIYELDPSCE